MKLSKLYYEARKSCSGCRCEYWCNFFPVAKLSPTVTIYCFEPDPINYALLNMNIELNHIKNIYTFNYALGKEQKFTTFYKNNMNYGDHRTAQPLNGDYDIECFNTSSNRVHSVNIVEFLKQCLDERSPEYFDVVKIDAQGSDLEILESCLPLMKEVTTVVMEYSPYHLLRNGTSKEQVRNIFDYFSSFGVVMPNHPDMAVALNKNEILEHFDTLSATGNFYEVILKRKK
ncbi:FkbM family methyltransferase [Bacillus sp. TL12]|uniref:FkbM family methyltransferase n=1 Tax=Bacillus sp. TL12 TaxID=2894756 RepID=UPI0032205F3E